MINTGTDSMKVLTILPIAITSLYAFAIDYTNPRILGLIFVLATLAGFADYGNTVMKAKLTGQDLQMELFPLLSKVVAAILGAFVTVAVADLTILRPEHGVSGIIASATCGGLIGERMTGVVILAANKWLGREIKYEISETDYKILASHKEKPRDRDADTHNHDH